MSENPSIHVSTGFGGGISINLRADNYAGFLALAKDIYGDAAGQEFADAAFARAVAELSPVTNAVANLERGGLKVVPQPGAVRTNAAPPANDVPPGTEYPGDCAHGALKWVPGGFSKRTNKSYSGFYACTAPKDQQCDLRSR